MQAFNASNTVNNYYKKNWNTLYPILSYTQSDSDSNVYENLPFGKDQLGFPYTLEKYIVNKDFGKIRSTPYGNSLVFDFAKETMLNEQLGKNTTTDFLAISLSSTDYIGHAFGPNSIETEDTYLRLDKELENFLLFLDKQVGVNNYTVFLSADHGAAHIPGFLAKHKLPNGGVDMGELENKLNEHLKQIFGIDSLNITIGNYQCYLNHALIAKNNLDIEKVIFETMGFLQKQTGIDRVVEYGELPETVLPTSIKEQYTNGYYPARCGDIFFILKPGYIEDYNKGKGTTHGIWNPYDAHIPLLFYGFGINKGRIYNKVNMTDIAPTITALLHIQMPSGCIGTTINGVIKQ